MMNQSTNSNHGEHPTSSQVRSDAPNELTKKGSTSSKVRTKQPAKGTVSAEADSHAVVVFDETAQAAFAKSLQASALTSNDSALVDEEPVSEEQRIARIKSRERQMIRINVACAIQQGHDLQCLHDEHEGHWAAYCETEIEMSKRSADRYRAVWNLAHDCGTDVSHAARIAWSAWLQLIRDSTPAEAIRRAIEEARPPDALVTAQRVKKLVARHTKAPPKPSSASKRTELTTKSGVKIIVNHAADTQSIVRALNEAIRELKQSQNSVTPNEQKST